MASLSNGIIVNSRDDLDAIQGTPQRAEFMDMLKGSIYRLEKDDVAKTWVVVKDASLIKQFGFLLKDFPDVTPPELPTYVPPVPEEPEYRIQRRAAVAAGGACSTGGLAGAVFRQAQLWPRLHRGRVGELPGSGVVVGPGRAAERGGPRDGVCARAPGRGLRRAGAGGDVGGLAPDPVGRAGARRGASVA